MDHSLKKLRIGSYNCRGFNLQKSAYIKMLLDGVDIFFVQEHWLTESQLCLFNDVSADFSFTAGSGIVSYEVLSGRPSFVR